MSGGIGRFINHSCRPNCNVWRWVVDRKPRVGIFVGDSGIAAGVEVTIDYKLVEIRPGEIQQCLCGNEECRGLLERSTELGSSGGRATQSKSTPPGEGWTQCNRSGRGYCHLRNRSSKTPAQRLSRKCQTKKSLKSRKSGRGAKTRANRIGQRKARGRNNTPQLVRSSTPAQSQATTSLNRTRLNMRR